MAGVLDVIEVLPIMHTHVSLEFRANLSGDRDPAINTVGVAEPAFPLPGSQQAVRSPNRKVVLSSPDSS